MVIIGKETEIMCACVCLCVIILYMTMTTVSFRPFAVYLTTLNIYI